MTTWRTGGLPRSRRERRRLARAATSRLPDRMPRCIVLPQPTAARRAAPRHNARRARAGSRWPIRRGEAGPPGDGGAGGDRLRRRRDLGGRVVGVGQGAGRPPPSPRRAPRPGLAHRHHRAPVAAAPPGRRRARWGPGGAVPPSAPRSGGPGPGPAGKARRYGPPLPYRHRAARVATATGWMQEGRPQWAPLLPAMLLLGVLLVAVAARVADRLVYRPVPYPAGAGPTAWAPAEAAHRSAAVQSTATIAPTRRESAMARWYVPPSWVGQS